ncbi:hypothetical protein [Candidatus Spongiihabitans sp.]|uniref:hypothetical protein n=1 Tax=Candidatus Spongiihabitans sp. TaxID=3101308 RepID=UPI003C7BF55B
MTATAYAEVDGSFDRDTTYLFRSDNSMAIPVTPQTDESLTWHMDFMPATNTDITPLARVNNENKTYPNIFDIEKFRQNQARKKSLDDALSELEELNDYAAEEELSPPSPTAKKIAEDILHHLTSKLPRYYAISLWEDGDIVVFSAGAGSRASVFCRANGGASLYVNSPNNHDYEIHHTLAQDLPIDSIIDAMKKIPA